MKEKGTLIDLIIHDLTGPLSVACTSLEGLLRKETRHASLSAQQKRTLERVLRNSTRAQRLLQEMIEVYRGEEGLFRRDRFLVEPVLRQAILDAIEMTNPETGDALASAGSQGEFAAILEKHGVYTTIEGRYRSEPFYHDEKKVGQIFRNLITNGLKFRRERIMISVAGERDLVVSVEDDGQGIPLEKQSYIFKRFFQTRDNPDAEIQKGLGFGLSCVKALIETMKGEITLLSGEGQGTCFTVRVPPLDINSEKEECT
jgi:signal transduction histidine kinase